MMMTMLMMMNNSAPELLNCRCGSRSTRCFEVKFIVLLSCGTLDNVELLPVIGFTTMTSYFLDLFYSHWQNSSRGAAARQHNSEKTLRPRY